MAFHRLGDQGLHDRVHSLFRLKNNIPKTGENSMKKIEVRFNQKPRSTFEKQHPVEVAGIAPNGQTVQLDLFEAFMLYDKIKRLCSFDMIDEFIESMERETT